MTFPLSLHVASPYLSVARVLGFGCKGRRRCPSNLAEVEGEKRQKGRESEGKERSVSQMTDLPFPTRAMETGGDLEKRRKILSHFGGEEMIGLYMLRVMRSEGIGMREGEREREEERNCFDSLASNRTRDASFLPERLIVRRTS